MANARTIRTVLPYIEVEHDQDYEQMWRWYIFGNVMANRLERRAVETVTYEALLEDGEPFPGLRNPGNLKEPWRPGGIHMSAPRGPLLQRIVRETWTKKGEWEVVND